MRMGAPDGALPLGDRRGTGEILPEGGLEIIAYEKKC